MQINWPFSRKRTHKHMLLHLKNRMTLKHYWEVLIRHRWLFPPVCRSKIRVLRHFHQPFFSFVLHSLFVCLLMWWVGNCSITESLPELIQQGPRCGSRRPALMASRLETTRSLECQPLTPPRSQHWLLKGEAQSWHQKRWCTDGQSFKFWLDTRMNRNFQMMFLQFESHANEVFKILVL